MAKGGVPVHVGVIMDGNGRWAQKQGEKREKGHFAGAARVKEVVTHLFERGVKIVSLYALSEENLTRPEAEVNGIRDRITEFAEVFERSFPGGDVRLNFIGNYGLLGRSTEQKLNDAATRTEGNGPRVLNILVCYGGISEVLRAMTALMQTGEEITESNLRKALGSGELPDPDLVIRTGGEKRLSGFMPLQTAYSELYFCDVLFPDITVGDVDAALDFYADVDRRYGGLGG